MSKYVTFTMALLIATVLVACSPAARPGANPSQRDEATQGTNAVAGSTARDIYVYKSPTCSCCHEWEAYMTAHGYVVHSMPTENMAELKGQMKVPEAAWSCHTAVINGFVVEGHVPVEAVEALLASGSEIDGISLPGMPAGSPGMPGEKVGSFDVLALSGGEMSAFGAF